MCILNIAIGSTCVLTWYSKLAAFCVILLGAVLLYPRWVLRSTVLHLILMDAILVQIEVHRFILLLLRVLHARI